MTAAAQLRLQPDIGVCDDANPDGNSPRQVCIALADSLRRQGVPPIGARANMIVDGEGTGLIDSGSILTCGETVLRVTMACEPCAYGAKLADIPVRFFREIDRYLAIVLEGGLIEAGACVNATSGVYPAAPPDFRTRTTWAIDYIPSGHVVTSLDFLSAIGAGKSYARVLPKWLAAAHTAGKPIHRVLTAGLTSPSWAPNALDQLRDEGLPTSNLANAVFPLTETLWFSSADRRLQDHAVGSGAL